MKRIQFGAEDEFFDTVEQYARHMDRSISNLALHALRQFIRRYKVPVGGLDDGVKDVAKDG